jgi:hypothetical protein
MPWIFPALAASFSSTFIRRFPFVLYYMYILRLVAFLACDDQSGLRYYGVLSSRHMRRLY